LHLAIYFLIQAFAECSPCPSKQFSATLRQNSTQSVASFSKQEIVLIIIIISFDETVSLRFNIFESAKLFKM
jgi:hypothetical protein